MALGQNPFTPTFGRIPPFMAGRDELIDELLRAFEGDPFDPILSSIFVGARGSGKTALLSYVSEQAASMGWIVASTSAGPGMLEDLEQCALRGAKDLIGTGEQRRLTGVNVAQMIGLEWEQAQPAAANWRTRMTNLLEQLEPHGTGLLITVDEVRPDIDEMLQLAMVYQHFVREGRQVALLMAGLPSKVSSLLLDESVSFLRRSSYHHLGRIEDAAVEDALAKTIELGGRTIDEDALVEAVRSIDGFPYMMQLVGHRTWNESPSQSTICLQDVERGVKRAAADIEHKVLETTYRELSKGDIRFLEAMLPDAGETDVADIKARMGKKSNYVSQYKRRLVAQGVIEDRGHGMLAIEIPFFKEYLRKRLT